MARRLQTSRVASILSTKGPTATLPPSTKLDFLCPPTRAMLTRSVLKTLRASQATSRRHSTCRSTSRWGPTISVSGASVSPLGSEYVRRLQSSDTDLFDPDDGRPRTFDLGDDAARLRWPWLRGLSQSEGAARHIKSPRGRPYLKVACGHLGPVRGCPSSRARVAKHRLSAQEKPRVRRGRRGAAAHSGWGAKTSALSSGNRASVRLFPAEPESFACGISARSR